MFTEMGDNVIVYGSNAQAFDAALWLTVHKKNVTIVTPNPASEFDMQQSQHAMRMMTTALYALGVQVLSRSPPRSQTPSTWQMWPYPHAGQRVWR